MSSTTALHESFRDSAQRKLIALTAAIVFLDGLALVYRWFLRRLNEQQMGLSPLNEFAYVFGPMLFEPILLFVVLYYTATTMDREIPLVALVPGLAVAVLVGGLAGQQVGIDIWPAFTPLGIVKGSNMLALHPQTFLYWQDLLGPLVRALLTAIAALGLAQAQR